MKLIGRALAALCFCTLAIGAASSHANITASVDRDRVALGDTLRLTITATDDEDLGKLDLRALSADFEILRRSTSSNTSIINGSYSSTDELLLEITPRREGVLAIPSMRLGQLATGSIQVVVAPAPTVSAGDETLLFEAELDRDSVYVQGQLVLTLRLQQAINLDDRSITELQLDNAFVRPLEQKSFQRTVNGRPWLVHEVRYVIFPEQSGRLEIPAQTFSARESTARRSLFDMGRGGRQVRRTTEALFVDVLPRPDTFPGTTWLPARELTVEESWSTAPEALRAGESATRTITLRGEGLQGAQLPPVLVQATEGLKYYPDQPAINDSEIDTGLMGSRVDSVAVVPTKAGRWQIPELRIPWWDTEANELRYAVLPGRQLDAAAGEQTPASTHSPLPEVARPADIGVDSMIPVAMNNSVRPWQIVSAISTAGWLFTLFYLIRSRRKKVQRQTTTPKTTGQTEKVAFRALGKACASNSAALARQAVIDWSAALFDQAPQGSLAQVATALGDPAMRTELESLNAALYRGDPSAWDGAALAQAAQRLRKLRGRAQDTSAEELQLYPQGT